MLLDTCTLLDLTTAPDSIGPAVLARLSDLSTELLVSAATAWEVAIKTSQGKLAGGELLLAAWEQNLLDLRAEAMPIDHEDAIRAGGLAWPHRDPFDRMLMAQSLRRNVPIATRDRAVLDAGITATIDTRP